MNKGIYETEVETEYHECNSGKMKKLTYKVVVTDPYEDDNADDEAYETETVY